MDVKSKMNTRFRDLQGGLFLTVTKADVGEGAGNFQKNGGDIMAWADPFFPDPSIPDSVKKAMMDAIETGFPASAFVETRAIPSRFPIFSLFSRAKTSTEKAPFTSVAVVMTGSAPSAAAIRAANSLAPP